jgi:hypothetical protein
MDTLSLKLTNNPSKRFRKTLPNNAYFMNFKQYQEKQDIFFREWEKDFNKDLKAYIAALSKKYPFL